MEIIMTITEIRNIIGQSNKAECFYMTIDKNITGELPEALKYGFIVIADRAKQPLINEYVIVWNTEQHKLSIWTYKRLLSHIQYHNGILQIYATIIVYPGMVNNRFQHKKVS